MSMFKKAYNSLPKEIQIGLVELCYHQSFIALLKQARLIRLAEIAELHPDHNKDSKVFVQTFEEVSIPYHVVGDLLSLLKDIEKEFSQSQRMETEGSQDVEDS